MEHRPTGNYFAQKPASLSWQTLFWLDTQYCSSIFSFTVKGNALCNSGLNFVLPDSPSIILSGDSKDAKSQESVSLSLEQDISSQGVY